MVALEGVEEGPKVELEVVEEEEEEVVVEAEEVGVVVVVVEHNIKLAVVNKALGLELYQVEN